MCGETCKMNVLLSRVASSHVKVQRPLSEYELLQVQASCRTSKPKSAMSASCPVVFKLFPILSVNSCYSYVTCRTAVTGGASPRRSNLVGTFGLLESISGVRARDASF